MDFTAGFLVVALQFGLMIATALGWGFWVWKLTGMGDRPVAHAWVICGLTGFAANTLLLQQLVYFDVRLQWSAWGGLAVALAGCAGWVRRQWKAGRGSWVGPGIFAVAGIVTVVFFVQGSALLYHGPRHYYGWAHTDHINYVILGQFLVEEPFSRKLTEVGMHPWITLANDFKEFRIGQSVTHGYLAVISGGDTQTTYGALTLFHVALLGVTTRCLLRALAAPETASFLGALWVSLLPAVTKIPLDGFLSQVAVLAVFPTMALTFLSIRTRPYLLLILNAVILSYLFCCYTEVFILGAGMNGLLWLSHPQLKVRFRVIASVLSIVGALLLAPSAVVRLVSYIARQYGVAAAEPSALFSLVPNAGTWLGWSEVFTGYSSALTPRAYHMNVLLGFIVIALMISGFLSRNDNKKILLGCIAAPPVAALAYLLSIPMLPKYTFAKLVDTFASVWVLLATLGLLRLQIFIRTRFGLSMRWPANVAICCFVLTAAYGTAIEQSQVIHDQGSLEYLEQVDAPASQRMYDFIDQNPEKKYLLGAGSFLVDAWMAYHARHSDVYLDSGHLRLGGRGLPDDRYPFYRIPTPPAGIWLMKDGAVEMGELPSRPPPKKTSAPPLLFITSSQGADRVGSAVSYWVGKKLNIEIVQASDAPPTVAYQFGFGAAPGPANPIARRLLKVIDGLGHVEQREINAAAQLSFPLTVKPGTNRYRLEIAEPEQTVTLPGDPRDLMLFVTQPYLVEE